MRLEGGWVVNVPPAGLKLLEETIDLSVVDVTIYPPGRNPLGGWGDLGDQTIYVTPYLYVYVFVHSYVPMLICIIFVCVTFEIHILVHLICRRSCRIDN